jgi:hypothetical protein
MTNLTKEDWSLIDKYKGILVYNTYRISFRDELEKYNIFDNLNTLLWSCRAIEQYKVNKDVEELKENIICAVMLEQYFRFEYESVLSNYNGKKTWRIDTYNQFVLNADLFIQYLISKIS